MADLLRTYHLEVSALAHVENFKAYQESDTGRAAYPIACSSGYPLGESVVACSLCGRAAPD